jgi:hypothetical protein
MKGTNEHSEGRERDRKNHGYPWNNISKYINQTRFNMRPEFRYEIENAHTHSIHNERIF